MISGSALDQYIYEALCFVLLFLIIFRLLAHSFTTLDFSTMVSLGSITVLLEHH